MIGLIWNVRGLENTRALTDLKRLLKKRSSDFVFLSETKLQDSKVVKVKDNLGNFDGF